MVNEEDHSSLSINHSQLASLLFFPNHIDHPVEERIGDGNGEMVLGDFPLVVDLDEHAGPPAFAEAFVVQNLVEPGRLFVG